MQLEQTELNKRKWDARADTFDRKRHDYFRWMQKRVVRLAELKPGIRFLDVGCGTGWAVRHAAELLDFDGEFHGVDISDEMIAKAVEQSPESAKVHFHGASADDLPIESDSIDCAICTNSFHHYPNPVSALTEIGRVLSTKGRLYVLDITTDDFLMRWINGIVQKREPEHVKFYASAEFQAMFEAANLKYLQTRTLAYPEKVHIAMK